MLRLVVDNLYGWVYLTGMARMVFGKMTEAYAPPKAEHFATSKLVGTKTACGLTIRGAGYARSSIITWKDAKMVTCVKCRKAMGV